MAQKLTPWINLQEAHTKTSLWQDSIYYISHNPYWNKSYDYIPLPKKFIKIIREFNGIVKEQQKKQKETKDKLRTILEIRKETLEWLKSELSRIDPKKQKEEDWTVWKNLAPEFTEELVRAWKYYKFSYLLAKEWIDIGLKAYEFGLANYLKKREITPDNVLNNHDGEELKNNYQNWKKKKDNPQAGIQELISRMKEEVKREYIFLDNPVNISERLFTQDDLKRAFDFHNYKEFEDFNNEWNFWEWANYLQTWKDLENNNLNSTSEPEKDDKEKQEKTAKEFKIAVNSLEKLHLRWQIRKLDKFLDNLAIINNQERQKKKLVFKNEEWYWITHEENVIEEDSERNFHEEKADIDSLLEDIDPTKLEGIKVYWESLWEIAGKNWNSCWVKEHNDRQLIFTFQPPHGDLANLDKYLFNYKGLWYEVNSWAKVTPTDSWGNNYASPNVEITCVREPFIRWYYEFFTHGMIGIAHNLPHSSEGNLRFPEVCMCPPLQDALTSNTVAEFICYWQPKYSVWKMDNWWTTWRAIGLQRYNYETEQPEEYAQLFHTMNLKEFDGSSNFWSWLGENDTILFLMPKGYKGSVKESIHTNTQGIKLNKWAFSKGKTVAGGIKDLNDYIKKHFLSADSPYHNKPWKLPDENTPLPYEGADQSDLLKHAYHMRDHINVQFVWNGTDKFSVKLSQLNLEEMWLRIYAGPSGILYKFQSGKVNQSWIENVKFTMERGKASKLFRDTTLKGITTALSAAAAGVIASNTKVDLFN